MKYIYYIVITLLLISCKTITKEEYLSNSCDCINNITINNNENFKIEIADCLSDNFVTFNKMAKKEIENYLTNNPGSSREKAQEYLVEMLHDELSKKCPTYKEANKKLDN